MRRGRLAVVAAVLAAAAAAVPVAVGGTHSNPPPPSDATAATSTRTARTATSTTRTSPATSSTPTTPQEDLPGYGKPPVLLGDKNTPEQFLLGQLYTLALQNDGYTVQLTRNIGPMAVTMQALRQGSLDMYPEYLGVWDTEAAGIRGDPSSAASALAQGREYAHRHGLMLLPPTPFSDTAGVIVRSEYASGNRLHTIGNLASVAQFMTFGAPLPFTDARTGLPALEHTYGFKPAIVTPLNVGAGYSALGNDLVEAAYGDTTDPQLASPKYRLLTDPKHALGFGNVVPVVSRKTVKAEGPAFTDIIKLVDSLLTTRVVRGLNAEIELHHDDPAVVARTFLEGNGLLPPPAWATTGFPSSAG